MDYFCNVYLNTMKMNAETIAIIGILGICWIIILILDLTVSGIMRLTLNLPFGKTFAWGLLSLAVPPICLIYGTLIERNLFKVNKVEIAFEALPESFDGYRIVHISDIHARSFARRTESLRKAVDKINSLEADLTAFTGDLITMRSDEIDSISGILSSIKAEDGIMSVLGNHDYCIYAGPEDKGAMEDDVRNVIEKQRLMGWELLVNENRIIRKGADSIAVIGVGNTSPSRHFPSKGDLSKASEGTEDMFRILLSHDPMHWDAEITGKEYPLTLSGHTHAMQFSLFGWCPSRYMFKQYKGLYENDGQFLYVNIGLGETIFPARIGARPEITLITLRKGH